MLQPGDWDRFFREGPAATALNHVKIVMIHNVREEHFALLVTSQPGEPCDLAAGRSSAVEQAGGTRWA